LARGAIICRIVDEGVIVSWKDKIAGGFGFGTAPFAWHRPDQDRAKDAIKAAKAEGVSREEFAKEIAMYAGKYIKSEHVLRERLRQDGAMFDKLWKTPRFSR
jgi:hypothetical protein